MRSRLSENQLTLFKRSIMLIAFRQNLLIELKYRDWQTSIRQ